MQKTTPWVLTGVMVGLALGSLAATRSPVWSTSVMSSATEHFQPRVTRITLSAGAELKRTTSCAKAALANDPPSGTFYDPNHASATQRLPSLGVHERWNNPQEKRYSRNLGTGDGVELVSVKLGSGPRK